MPAKCITAHLGGFLVDKSIVLIYDINKEVNIVKKCHEEIMNRIVATLELASGTKEEKEEIIAGVKDLIAEKEREERKKELKSFFEAQIETLRDRGCPLSILKRLDNQIFNVIDKASEMTLEEGHIPFLPVIPQLFLSILSQVEMIRVEDIEGFTSLDPREITDLIETPNEPYYIFDIEDGRSLSGETTQVAAKLISDQGRRCLTAAEVIALGIHTNFSLRQTIDASGSRYHASDKVVALYYSGKGAAELVCDSFSTVTLSGGSASCSRA